MYFVPLCKSLFTSPDFKGGSFPALYTERGRSIAADRRGQLCPPPPFVSLFFPEAGVQVNFWPQLFYRRGPTVYFFPPPYGLIISSQGPDPFVQNRLWGSFSLIRSSQSLWFPSRCRLIQSWSLFLTTRSINSFSGQKLLVTLVYPLTLPFCCPCLSISGCAARGLPIQRAFAYHLG